MRTRVRAPVETSRLRTASPTEVQVPLAQGPVPSVSKMDGTHETQPAWPYVLGDFVLWRKFAERVGRITRVSRHKSGDVEFGEKD
ncbi:MAG: hypothetical protein K0S79_2919 [Nitrospira sp.]|nr:hypothetical protein [Nitrospira sp.]